MALEQELRELFEADAAGAPVPAGLAASARGRARRDRGRLVLAAAAVVLLAGGAAFAGPRLLPEGEPEIAARPVSFEPLTGAECPKGINGSGPPDIFELRRTPPPQEQVRKLGTIVAGGNPGSKLTGSRILADTAEFVYTVPSGTRVALIRYQQVKPGIWHLASMQHC